MNKYMTYEDRLDRMMEYGEPEDYTDFRRLEAFAMRRQREDDRQLAESERFDYGQRTKAQKLQDLPLDPPEE
jgi:hypothetical protein